MDTNLIEQWREQNGATWEEMAKQAGVGKNTLLLLRHLQPEQFGSIRLSTVALLKQNLGIDLMQIYESHLQTQGAAPKGQDNDGEGSI